MSDETSKEEFPDNKQRYAVCMSYWGNKKKNENLSEEFVGTVKQVIELPYFHKMRV